MELKKDKAGLVEGIGLAYGWKKETTMNKGKVYLVGAGPGDPKLITVYGLECIQKADVIAYDRLVSKELLNHAKKEAELIYCGKLPGKHEMIQEQIHELLVEKALEGKVVTRLKGGDPFVFGRGGEEAEVLASHGIPYEVVPGITSGIAAPAYAGIPVTHRDYASSFAIVTGHGRAEKGNDHINWPALAQGIDTIAFYMGIGNLSHICMELIKHGKNPQTPVAVIQWGTTSSQIAVTGDLETIEEKVRQKNIVHPAIVLVGQVVKMGEKIKWFEDKL
jgi:uroporphyrin-III C-methyltransferase